MQIIDNSTLKVGDRIVITSRHGGDFVKATGIIIDIPPEERHDGHMTIRWKPLTAKVDYVLIGSSYWNTTGPTMGTKDEVLFMKLSTVNDLGNFPKKDKEV